MLKTKKRGGFYIKRKYFIFLFSAIFLILSIIFIIAHKFKAPENTTQLNSVSKQIHTEKDYAFSFAVIGDTQSLVKNDVISKTHNTDTLYNWIIYNQNAKKIKCVIGLGDIVDSGENEYQWHHAIQNITRLNNKIPYYLARGNHDDEKYFNYFFKTESYIFQFVDPDISDQSECFYNTKKINNVYTKFTVNDTNFLVMLLDYGANDNVLAWANNVIAANPNYRVIISTHAFLGSDGSFIDSPDMPNNGTALWQKLISKHKNIFLVLCGHDETVPNGDILFVQKEGKHGNIVNQLLIDPQNLEASPINKQYGLVAMLYFRKDGSAVDVEYISTVLSTKKGRDYIYNNNQFSFSIQ